MPRFFTYDDDKAACLKELAIIESLPAEDSLFTDPDFPADGSSLYKDCFRPPNGFMPSDVLDWNRINQLEVRGQGRPVTFTDKPEGENSGCEIVQGALGNCWLLNALLTISTRPAVAAAIIVSDSQRGRGIYTLKFNKDGQWLYVHVDDRIPCNRAGDVYFSRSADLNEAWVMIVEKAFAKLHGCYESLTGGHVDYALKDLTGCPVMKVRLCEKKYCAQIENGVMWQKLKDYYDSNQLMSLSRSCSADPRAHEGGIIGGHCYPVVEVCELHADSTADLDALDVKLVRILGCWNMGEWKGEWSEGSSSWSDYPDIKRIVHKKAKIPNSFWMSYKDVCKNFNQLFVSYGHGSGNATKQIYKGNWVMGDVKSGAGGNPSNESFPQNPQYAFAVSEQTNISISVSQDDVMLKNGMLFSNEYTTALGELTGGGWEKSGVAKLTQLT